MIGCMYTSEVQRLTTTEEATEYLMAVLLIPKKREFGWRTPTSDPRGNTGNKALNVSFVRRDLTSGHLIIVQAAFLTTASAGV